MSNTVSAPLWNYKSVEWSDFEQMSSGVASESLTPAAAAGGGGGRAQAVH